MTVDVIRERLANSFLIGKPLASPVDVVRRLGAVQAQDYPGAKWAVGMRTAKATNADVEQALARGDLLRTHVLRPTWHFVTREDIRWMLKLTGPRIAAVMNVYGKKLGLTPAAYRRSRAVIEKALSAGTHLTRAELAGALRAARFDASTERLTRLIMNAETEGVICSGACRGKHQTYALLDERAPESSAIERDEALSRLAHLYLTGHGPATVHDFSWWAGLSVGDARRGIEIAGADLTPIEIAGQKMWMVERESPAPPAIKTAHLLPNYDEYFIGHRDRSAIGRRLKGVHLVTGGDASITHVVIVGGELVGGWRRVPPGAGTTANVTFAVRVTSEERALVERQRARFSAFFA